MPRKHVISVRLSDAGKEAVGQIATEEDRSLSDMCRVLIAEAVVARNRRKPVQPAGGSIR